VKFRNSKTFQNFQVLKLLARKLNYTLNYSATSGYFFWTFCSKLRWLDPVSKKNTKKNFLGVRFHKIFQNFRKNRIFHFFQKIAKIMFDLKFTKSIKNKGGRLNLGVPWLILNKIFKKLKISIFFKKVISQKREFRSNSKSLFILPCPTKENT